MILSIIVPHKDSSALLERLLMSIPSNDEFEVIVVDDNSKKCEKENLCKIVSTYKFHLYEMKNNVGAGACRNLALKKAKGEWVLFADSDDYFVSNMYEIIGEGLKSKADIVYFRTDSIYNDTGKQAYRHENYNQLIDTYLMNKNAENLKFKFLVPWAKLFKRSLISSCGAVFEEIPAGNDMNFSVLVALSAHSVEIVDKVLYIVTVSRGSITTTFSKEKFDSRFQASVRCNRLLREHGMGKYQQSILYFIVKGYKFGFKYLIHMWVIILKTKSNPFIGFSKLVHYKKVLQDRENPRYLLKSKSRL